MSVSHYIKKSWRRHNRLTITVRKTLTVETRKTLDGQAIGIMIVLCLVWSMQQVGIKATAGDVAPVLQIGLRSGIAAVLVGLVMWARKESITPALAAWRPGAAAGVLFALEYALLGAGLHYTSAAHAVVFLYTGPLFAALGLHLKLPLERLAPIQWLGVGVSFAGVGIAFLFDPGTSGQAAKVSTLWGDFLCLSAGAAWGVTTVVIRCSSLSKLQATQTALYQLIGAFVLLLGAAIASDQLVFAPTPMAIANLVFQSVIVSFASLLAWFHLLRRYLASRLGIFSFMTPLFGTVLGAWLLDEHIQPSFIAGAGLVLAGVMLVCGYGWLTQAWAVHVKRKAA
nr:MULTISPECIES: DMT family transporter [unclassified Duganella]